MTIGLIFWALVLSACAYVIICGGWEGKVASLATLAVSLTTMVVDPETPWTSLKIDILLADIGYMIVLYLVALRSRYYWVVWMCGFQLAGVATHLPGLFYSGVVSDIYEGLQGFWSIPVIIVMVFGVNSQKKMTNGQRRSHFGQINSYE